MKTGLHERKAVIEIPDRSGDEDAPAYVAARRFADEVLKNSTPEGQARMAEMIAAKRGPAHKVEGGNDSFFQNRHNGQQLDGMQAAVRDRYLAKAKDAGVSVHGKVYVSTLAEEPGDPKAWVSDTSEVKARCEQEGWDCEGVVNHTAKNPGVPASEKRAKKALLKKLTKAVA